ncbi:MAG: ROK family protein [Treponema sp.]|jgi:glucokinase|nr:ROK family protein [Treponema sp.]
MFLVGVDIGGTKCKVSLGRERQGKLEFIAHGKPHATAEHNCAAMLDVLLEDVLGFAEKAGEKPAAIGISCGGPLDQKQGLILSPPNLPGWARVPITDFFSKAMGIPAFLLNDADACALAEWKYGAGFDKSRGQSCANMIFLTFGTGLGAGLILDGKLYQGANGMAGEAGHIRMTDNGPLGFGKRGSLEGWCSGGGLSGAYFDLYGEKISGGEVCIRAERGDEKALKVTEGSAFILGRFLALIIDIINPDRIVIGSIFARSEGLFRNRIEEIIKEESLPLSAGVCSVHPAALGESLGDAAALCAAINGLASA